MSIELFMKLSSFFKVCYFTFPLLVYKGPSCSTFLPTFGLVTDFRHCNWYLVSLVCISIMTDDGHLFKCLFTILVLANCSNILLTFSLAFLMIEFRELFILHGNYYQMLFAVHSQSVACFFINNVFLTFCLFLTLLNLQRTKYKRISTWVLANYVVEYT